MEKPDSTPTPEEMLEALTRSGYLLEGRLVTLLDDLGLFVESSPSFLDKNTGISRELDITAEYQCFEFAPQRIYVSTHLVIEAINNLYPVALLTNKIWNPHGMTDDLIPHLVFIVECSYQH